MSRGEPLAGRLIPDGRGRLLESSTSSSAGSCYSASCSPDHGGNGLGYITNGLNLVEDGPAGEIPRPSLPVCLWMRGVVWVHTAPPQDDVVARALHDRCGVHIARRDYGYLKVIGLMKHAGLVLTDRYHACIFAIIAGCPVLPFESNTWKIQDFSHSSSILWQCNRF